MPNAFAHIELTTDDLAKADKFYRAVFAWKLRAMPGMNYTMIDVGEGTGGGMQSKPMPDAPTGWLPYVVVDDVNKTMAKVTKAGGTVLLDYHDIGEMGAIGVFRDPSGSALGIWAAKPQAKATAKVTSAATKKKVSKKASKKKVSKGTSKKKASKKKASKKR